jgi:hypothetical protein
MFILVAKLRNKPNTVPAGFPLLLDKFMSTYILRMTNTRKVVDFEPGVMERLFLRTR